MGTFTTTGISKIEVWLLIPLNAVLKCKMFILIFTLFFHSLLRRFRSFQDT